MRVVSVILFLVLLVCSHYSVAQQDAQYSQYMFNTFAINPAYAGSRDVISATALHRKQWVNTPGSPRTTTFSVDAPFKSEKIGLGLMVFNDKIGISNTTGVYAGYAYRLFLKRGTLAMGLQAGFSQFNADFASVSLDEQNQYDAAFANSVQKFMPNFGTGVYYNTDKFYVGISLPRLVNNKLFKKDDKTEFTSARQSRHIFIMSGLVVPLSSDLKLKPSTLLKIVSGSPIQIDLNANLWLFDIASLGLSYRIAAHTLVSMIEVQATRQIRFGYSYDGGFGKITTIGKGAHEIMLRYEFGYVKNKMTSPRYF